MCCGEKPVLLLWVGLPRQAACQAGEGVAAPAWFCGYKVLARRWSELGTFPPPPLEGEPDSHPYLIDTHPTHFTSSCSQVGLSRAWPVLSCVGPCAHAHAHSIHTSSHHPLPLFLQVLLTHIPSSTQFTGTHAYSPACIHRVYKRPTPLLPLTWHRHRLAGHSGPLPPLGAPRSRARMSSHLHMHVYVHIHVCIHVLFIQTLSCWGARA